jgi:UPF0042 nucleotide-binding protein
MQLISFAYAFGAPRTATRVYDLRHFPAPNASLCALYDGRDRRLQQELLQQPAFQELLAQVSEEWSGGEFVTLAFGCMEGRHRSVAVVEALAREWSGVAVEHRDLGRRQRQRATELDRRQQRQRRYVLPLEL